MKDYSEFGNPGEEFPIPFDKTEPGEEYPKAKEYTEAGEEFPMPPEFVPPGCGTEPAPQRKKAARIGVALAALIASLLAGAASGDAAAEKTEPASLAEIVIEAVTGQ